MVVTGYGRHLVAPALGGKIVSEIRAFAVGARHLYPDCPYHYRHRRQDCKVILLTDDGQVQNLR